MCLKQSISLDLLDYSVSMMEADARFVENSDADRIKNIRILHIRDMYMDKKYPPEGGAQCSDIIASEFYILKKSSNVVNKKKKQKSEVFSHQKRGPPGTP